MEKDKRIINKYKEGLEIKKTIIGLIFALSVFLIFSQAMAAPAPATPAATAPTAGAPATLAPACPFNPGDASGAGNLSSADASLGTCDCSKCRANQYCCPTANGYCGCFPMPCP